MVDVRSPDVAVIAGPSWNAGESVCALRECPSGKVGRGSNLDVDVLVVVDGLGAKGVPSIADLDDRWIRKIGIDDWAVDCTLDRSSGSRTKDSQGC